MNEEKSSFIKGINEQHPAAYHQLYNEYYKALVLYAINFLSSQQAAEDIVQDLFATMWEKKMRFLSLPSFRTYLYNSIRNASLNYLKHQNVESLSILNAWQALIEKSQKKKIPTKKKYTGYYFVLSTNCQYAAGKYSYYI